MPLLGCLCAHSCRNGITGFVWASLGAAACREPAWELFLCVGGEAPLPSAQGRL